MTRREFSLLMPAAFAAAAPPRSKMGVATTSYMTFGRPRDTIAFLEQCNALGAGGIQAGLTSTDPEYVKRLRARAEELGMYYETIIGLPRTDGTPFESTVAAAKAAGSLCLRVSCGGRRYEDFKSLEQRKRTEAEWKASIERALVVAERHKIPLGLENHKDWTLDEHLALYKQYSSEYFQACLDTGNNIALLDDPMEVVEKLAPYAVCTHIKDMAVEEYPDGFLLSEVPLGEGMLDIKRMAEIIQRARPASKFSLEMITRNPLKIPCLTDSYWISFPDRRATYLARTLRMVREKRSKQPLPRMDGLDREAQLRVENDNVKQCLNYAREQLGL